MTLKIKIILFKTKGKQSSWMNNTIALQREKIMMKNQARLRTQMGILSNLRLKNKKAGKMLKVN